MTAKTYSNRSNARRAAIAAGIPADMVRVDPQGDAFVYSDLRHAVLLATEDDELGLIPGHRATEEAQSHANETGQTVFIRNVDTDEVLGEVKPTNGKVSNRAAIAAKAKSADTLSKRLAKTRDLNRRPKAAAKAKAKTKTPKAKPAAAREGGEPTGMVAKIIKLACRANGVTPTELNELTKWKGAPWKWLMSNRKGTGYGDRWGYTVEVIKDGRSAAYKMTKVAA